MTEKENISGKISELRMRAEQKAAKFPENTVAVSSMETQNLLHELRVHQIELEVQNDELRTSQLELEAARMRYFDLYDLAPVGYCTISEKGLIMEANLTASNILGVFRNTLIGRLFSKFIFKEDRDIFYLHRKNLSDKNEPQAFDLRMLRKDGTFFWAHLIATVSQAQDNSGQSADSTSICRIVLSDISESRRMEELRSFLAKTGCGLGDESFFNTLARYIAEGLKMDFVCIDRLEGDGLSATTLAVWCDGHFEDNITYALKDTPCGDVVGKDVCCFPASVCQFFPKDQVLKDLRAESYIGVTLWSHTGRPIGLIAVIGRSPLKNRPLAEAMLKLVALRTASEIERLDVESELRLSESELAEAQSLAHVGNWHVTFKEGGEVWRGSDEICRIYGYPTGMQWTMQSIFDRVHPDDRERLRKIWSACFRGEGPSDWEHRIVADGLVKWVHVKAKFRFDETGRPIEANGVCQDITDRKLTAQALEEKMNELQRFQKLTVGRELTMIELKKEINRLLKKSGQEEKYRIVG